MCRFCVTDLEKHGGGAEIPVSVLYADVRGSTALAESLAPAEFTKQLGHFYKSSAKAIDAQLGVIDHIAGDGVMAMWIPAFVRGDHPQRAVAAGRAMAKELATDESVHVGVGVHTGEAYVGVVGETGSRDFTVLGDVANTVARLGSEAGPGELMMSDAIATAAGVVTEHLEHRALELKGKAQPFGTWVERVGSIVPGN